MRCECTLTHNTDNNATRIFVLHPPSGGGGRAICGMPIIQSRSRRSAAYKARRIVCVVVVGRRRRQIRRPMLQLQCEQRTIGVAQCRSTGMQRRHRGMRADSKFQVPRCRYDERNDILFLIIHDNGRGLARCDTAVEGERTSYVTSLIRTLRGRAIRVAFRRIVVPTALQRRVVNRTTSRAPLLPFVLIFLLLHNILDWTTTEGIDIGTTIPSSGIGGGNNDRNDYYVGPTRRGHSGSWRVYDRGDGKNGRGQCLRLHRRRADVDECHQIPGGGGGGNGDEPRQ